MICDKCRHVVVVDVDVWSGVADDDVTDGVNVIVAVWDHKHWRQNG